MSLFQNLVETYDRLAETGKAGGIADNAGNILLPTYHMMMNTDVCVTLDGFGNFLRAESKKLNIMLPCTEESASRTGQTAPHPLHEQLSYLALDSEKVVAHRDLLGKWSNKNAKVRAVHNYLLKNTVLKDLTAAGVEKLDAPKLFIRFAVEIPYDLDSEQWKDPELWKDIKVAAAWQAYCDESAPPERDLCYITGQLSPTMQKHPKGVNPDANGAKLISCDDDANKYTYRGRFTKKEQPNAIGKETSYKAHAALKYIVASQSCYKCNAQSIVVWAIDSKIKTPRPFPNSLGLIRDTNETEAEKLENAQGELGADYVEKLRGALYGSDGVQKLLEYQRKIAVLALDAATEGRMSVTFYQELPENEYIDRLLAWHKTCCWHFRRKGGSYISAPSAYDIIGAVYGELTGESYNLIKRQALERILHYILRKKPIDAAWLNAGLSRVSNPFSYTDREGKWEKRKWDTAVAVVCALARKYYKDKKEDFKLELELERRDRDYLYGRLLAIADKLEGHARYLQTEKDDAEKRPTNAVRYLQRFAVKPFNTWGLLYAQLNPYIQRLNGAEWYQAQIDGIMALFSEGEFESDRPLTAKYLMGYSLQRRAMKSKKTDTDNFEEEITDDNEED